MEEHACLVRARSDSESSSKLGSFGSIAHTMSYTEDRLTEGGGDPGITNNIPPPPDNNDINDSGELLDYNDSSVLEQFHEDALRQAGCGLSQGKVILSVGLAVVGSALEMSSIPFVLPSAEIELCVLPHEKNWLVMISIMGGSLGAVGWGALGERLGRRRALLSALAVNAVFAAIAAFMPTYGTFMMARFCSAIGSGGIIPTGYVYTAEMISRVKRTIPMAVFPVCMGVGILVAAGLARAILPLTGAETLIENKEHFSAWHRYLLLCVLPIIASLISLIWTQESPRYLLDVGREVDAMMVYQSIHSGNQIRVCRKVSVSNDGDYRLGELSLPGKRRPPALHHVRHSVKMFWQTFFQLFSNTYRSTTVSLGGTLLFSMAISFYLSAAVPSTVLSIETEAFLLSRRRVTNLTYENENYNETLENIDFYDVTFRNVTFRDMLMSHVTFYNNTFLNVAFSNIKTSYTSFKGCLFVNSTMIDTDIEIGKELDDCTLTGSTVRGVKGGCSRHADLTSTLSGPLAEQTYGAYAALLASVPVAAPHALRPPVILCGALVLLSPTLYFAQIETALYIVEAAYRLIVTVIFFTISIKVVDSYPANLRCTAHGLILSTTYMWGTAVRGMGDFGLVISCILCALSAITATALSVRIR
ncbi:synaptic vesicle glycoprotein 2C-like [Pieris brassicae]|uniref:synaptic vesicle glycoprotein 2C-like n=1 Tax=Pieris brassicae TaxID=7116 RepID=UPI001E65ED73|nr:synaptic vesicle glycoprotein 2C-like [Pieris brassicae]XP_045528832.1 synaptic vesicle glycoprotein 2C-like [Pieris brassicae]XP_045528833.1 synaptic vesicle glycoprotein 2C-like [Pieris brassicae]XP_045528834.1 synaptic vesicle glycoprotein 2C-like [Pieris brassicae]